MRRCSSVAGPKTISSALSPIGSAMFTDELKVSIFVCPVLSGLKVENSRGTGLENVGVSVVPPQEGCCGLFEENVLLHQGCDEKSEVDPGLNQTTDAKLKNGDCKEGEMGELNCLCLVGTRELLGAEFNTPLCCAKVRFPFLSQTGTPTTSPRS